MVQWMQRVIVPHNLAKPTIHVALHMTKRIVRVLALVLHHIHVTAMMQDQRLRHDRVPIWIPTLMSQVPELAAMGKLNNVFTPA